MPFPNFMDSLPWMAKAQTSAKGITYGNNIYMLVGSKSDGSCVAISTDGGHTYTVQDSLNIPYIDTPNIACIFAKGGFVIADYINIKYYRSSDGIEWGGHVYA